MDVDMRRLQNQVLRIPKSEMGPRQYPNTNLTISLTSGLSCKPVGGLTGRVPIDESFVREYIVDPNEGRGGKKIMFKKTASDAAVALVHACGLPGKTGLS